MFRTFLLGLRKFRRQATIDEKIQKSVSMADVVAAAAEPDELDDIDKVRKIFDWAALPEPVLYRFSIDYIYRFHYNKSKHVLGARRFAVGQTNARVGVA